FHRRDRHAAGTTSVAAGSAARARCVACDSEHADLGADEDGCCEMSEPANSSSESGAGERWVQSMLGMGDRSNYKKVWNRQAGDGNMAALAVAGHHDEKIL